MTKSIVAIILGCLSAFVMGRPSHENQTLLPNGTSWKALSSAEKLLYVGGFQQGYRQGSIDGMGLDLKLQLALLSKTHCDCEPPPQAPTKEEALKVMQKEALDQKLPFFGDSQTSLQHFVDTMAVFYGDYRNMPVCWDNALRFSAGSLEGRAATEQELDAARKADAASGCK